MIKIAVIGPESSGKSTLCEELSLHFGQDFIREYSRTYLDELNRPYHYEDLNKIAVEQFQKIKSTSGLNKDKYLIADTEVITVKVWSEVKYGKCDEQLHDLIQKQDFDLYLLCNTDVEWSFDPLREIPDLKMRKNIFLMFEKELKLNSFRYEIVSGQNEERLNNAINHIESYIKDLGR